MSDGNLLPKTTSDFTDPQYWRRFFSQRKTPFEWYGDYDQLGQMIEKYAKPSDKILQLGCGNSQLASQMFENGFYSIHSVDIDEKVVEQQRTKNMARHGLSWGVENVTQLSLGDESSNVVLDKGTLDALLPPSASEEQNAAVEAMFSQVARIIQIGGRYVVVTLAQPHIVDSWLNFFIKTRQFLLRVHRLQQTASSNFPMPVVFLVATKLRTPMPGSLEMLELAVGEDKPQRFCDVDTLKAAILAEQELARFVHLCSSPLSYQPWVDFESADGSGPRFRIHIVDDSNIKEVNTFAIFVVPLGREADSIFSTEKGRKRLRAQTEMDRLVVVTLFRNQKYPALSSLKHELSHLNRFDPRKNSKFDILSMGETDVRRIVATGTSEMNGDWSVEDVVVNDEEFRRLVFGQSLNVIQTEAKLTLNKKKNKVVQLDSLTCDHHSLMMNAFAMLPSNPLADPNKANIKIAVLGLGGGMLCTYLLRRFKSSKVVGVDIDPEMSRIAEKYFSLPISEKRLRVSICDAREYLKEQAKAESRLDVLLVDVAGPMHDDGLSCPPRAFVQSDVLVSMRDAITDNGIVGVNLLTRDDEVADEVRQAVADVFPMVYQTESEEDVNQVLLCTKNLDKFDSKRKSKSLQGEKWITEIARDLINVKLIYANGQK